MNKLLVALLNGVIVIVTLLMITLYYGLSSALGSMLSDSEIRYAMFKLVYPNILSVLLVFGVLFFVNKYTYSVKTSLYIYLFSLILSFLVISFWATGYYINNAHRQEQERIPVVPVQ